MAINQGLKAELKVSLLVHQRRTPFLISSLVMRRLGLAQVDLAYLENGKVILLEVKSSTTGLEVFERKKARLLKAQNYLSIVLNCPVILRTHNDQNCQSTGQYLS